MAAHGTVSSYNAGCRCDECRTANTVKSRKNRKRRAAGLPSRQRAKPPGTVHSLNGPQLNESATVINQIPTEPGAAESAVITATGALSGAGDRPELVAQARAMARIIDNPGAIGTHPSANKQLSETMERLRTASVGRKRRLSDVRSLSSVRKPDTSTG